MNMGSEDLYKWPESSRKIWKYVRSYNTSSTNSSQAWVALYASVVNLWMDETKDLS